MSDKQVRPSTEKTKRLLQEVAVVPWSIQFEESEIQDGDQLCVDPRDDSDEMKGLWEMMFKCPLVRNDGKPLAINQDLRYGCVSVMIQIMEMRGESK